VTSGEVPPPDEAAHLDSRLMAELSTLNHLLAQHIVRFYDADAGRSAPTPVADDLALADALTAASNTLHARAARRERATEIVAGTEDA
jgi:hypothetical protein